MKNMVLLPLILSTYVVLGDVPYKNVAAFALNGDTIFIEFEEYRFKLKEDFCYYDHMSNYKGEAEDLIKARVASRFNSLNDSIIAYEELVLVPLNESVFRDTVLHIVRKEYLISESNLIEMELVSVYKGNPYGFAMFDERMSEAVMNDLKKWNEVYKIGDGECELIFVGKDQKISNAHQDLAERLMKIRRIEQSPARNEEINRIHNELRGLGLSALGFCSG